MVYFKVQTKGILDKIIKKKAAVKTAAFRCGGEIGI